MSSALQPAPVRRTATLRAVLSGVAGLALAVTLAGCGDGDASSQAQPSPDASAGATASAEATAGLVVRDPWVKAADDGMTAAFGVLVNDTDADITITGVSTDISPIELHEMAMADGAMVMREKPGGIVVPAGGSHTLEPGGDHIMLMDIAQPVQPGDEVTFTVTFADGATSQFTAVAKPFAGAEESYDPGTGMDHG
ncbi:MULTISPECIES: copper chaperone PCu(A)C [unclassified Solwaraspora]|uniref:copper chaperone PCu(A)C n=1 Tax=unclassified Solwaraspora TaxID=2627926 RepID=UPI00259B1C4B|nr:copper chaperone PCu(A)C [Solwaraspora sp. WMMA2056]WJK39598.1 copper chaperone PCu(A)C [Solwaraspora sp. WMMA2056]